MIIHEQKVVTILYSIFILLGIICLESCASQKTEKRRVSKADKGLDQNPNPEPAPKVDLTGNIKVVVKDPSSPKLQMLLSINDENAVAKKISFVSGKTKNSDALCASGSVIKEWENTLPNSTSIVRGFSQKNGAFALCARDEGGNIFELGRIVINR